jgi:hypothetical protein
VGFGVSLVGGDFLGRFWGGSGGAALSLDADELESNKFSACFTAWVMPLPSVEVEDAFLPATLTPAIEASSVGLSPEDFTSNLLLRFTGLASASSCADV